MGQLDGKGALVTGGARGIGRAIVTRLAADGAAVVFSYRSSEEAARQVADEVAQAGGKAFAVRADQGSLDDLDGLLAEADQRLDGLDIVVINAADAPVIELDDVTEEAFDQHMAVIAKGPFFLIQRAGRRLRDGGRIIAISSLNTIFHSPVVGLYSGGKGALEQFTAVAAHAYGGRGITANVVSPGWTDTDMLHNANPGVTFEREVELTPLKRLGQPRDIAGVVAFLAGPDGAWVNGQNIRADGGVLA